MMEINETNDPFNMCQICGAKVEFINYNTKQVAEEIHYACGGVRKFDDAGKWLEKGCSNALKTTAALRVELATLNQKSSGTYLPPIRQTARCAVCKHVVRDNNNWRAVCLLGKVWREVNEDINVCNGYTPFSSSGPELSPSEESE